MSNIRHDTVWVMKKLEENPEFDVLEYGCLGNCGECFMEPYAMVNGEYVSGETPEQLYDNILAAIEEAEKQFDLYDFDLD